VPWAVSPWSPVAVRCTRYACLYVDARNAMLSRLLYEGRDDLAVVAVDVGVLDIEGAIVTDRNAASGVALFLTTQRPGSPRSTQPLSSRPGGMQIATRSSVGVLRCSSQTGWLPTTSAPCTLREISHSGS